jgi:hypothetical protein
MRCPWVLLLAVTCARPRPLAGTCVEPPRAAMDLGFDTDFTLRMPAGCATGPVSWRQVAGAPVTVRVTDGGRSMSARTPPLAPELAGRSGVLPFSPRTRGELTFLARWQENGAPVEQRVTVAAAARSRGLPNVPAGARVHLGGGAWRIVEAPPDSQLPAPIGASFVPDRHGAWVLADEAGHQLRLRSGRYDDTPLDCGRSGCHAAVTEAAAHSPMTTVLARGLASFPRDDGYPACAIACHATGEPSLHDGGFTDVASALLVSTDALERWETTPRPLRRLGGVGCLACHGPGAVPEESARWSILRADVCATCHDAPPRYGHVEAWRKSRMATADRDPRTAGPRCARCHDTAGFLAAAGALAGDHRAPPAAGPGGIGCAACHAVHAPGKPAGPALLRQVAVPASVGPLPSTAGRSAVCAGCHAPGDDATFSSAAALWLGRGGVDPRTGEPLAGPAPHRTIENGCLACHRAPAGAERGAGHTFTASADACRGCHGPLPADPALKARAARLWAALGQPAGEPPHAGQPALDRGTPRGRAAWNVLLVLEDPAASVHNPRYARRLLDAAEESLR